MKKEERYQEGTQEESATFAAPFCGLRVEVSTSYVSNEAALLQLRRRP